MRNKKQISSTTKELFAYLPLLAAAKNILDEERIAPFNPPKQDKETNRDMIQADLPKVLIG